ncbi:hypothetical protein SAMN05421819_1620 [Bryocella elongata]|uniref:Uncharacterized protein n=1 Tax=Bryocella elongata TaxID=863522 RepID=A0A1H5WKV1_9BACT|nr:hypothetical protein [Bryocella elongata]SEF99910.1 hypothetical protein SAMN05421819_1620 [Bryocella elongata]
MLRIRATLFLAALSVAGCVALAQQVMDNAAVLKLHNAGLSDDLVVQTISASPGHFDTGMDAMIALKKAGLSDRVVGAMIAKNANPAGPAPAAAPVAAASALPPGITDVGLYYQDKTGQWNEVASEIVHYKTGGVLKSFATGGIVKGDLNGNINGADSKLKVVSPVNVIIYLMEGQSPTEYQLLRLRPGSNYREFRSMTGGVIHSSTGANRDSVEFESKKIAPRVYQVTLPASIGKGEYGFLPPTGANSQGNAASSGKIYTFSLVE